MKNRILVFYGSYRFDRMGIRLAASRTCRAIAGTLGGDVSARSISLGSASLVAGSTCPSGALRVLAANVGGPLAQDCTRLCAYFVSMLGKAGSRRDRIHLPQISWPLRFQHDRHTYNKSR